MTTLENEGWTVFEAFFGSDHVEWMRAELKEAYETCRAIQVRNGVENTEHTVHHLIGQGRSWLACLDEMPNFDIAKFFGGPFILNSFGGQFNPPGATNYAAAVHRDIRSYFVERVMLNAIVLLDDFTEENGATWLMHHMSWLEGAKPDDEMFEKYARQVIAPVGSVVLFDSRVWHKAGVNRSGGPRRIVTPMYTQPFYKPQFDYCRVLGEDTFTLSDEMRQILGYNARIPATLDEWYRPKELRMYRADQG